MKQYDLLIKNGWIVDGSGEPRFRGDIGICGERIAAVGQLDGSAQILVDANGKIVSPGFIDVHTHSDSSPFSSESCESKVQQGVTTEVTGNCGSSPFPAKGATNHLASTAAFLAGVKERGYASNLCALVGHGRLRGYVMGQALRDPTEEEMQQMEALLRAAMEEGAYGMSLGLIYPPSSYSKYDEILRLAKIVAEYNGIVSVHMRNEGDRVFEAVEEMLSIAKETGVRVEISHVKIASKNQWGKADQIVAMLDEARAKGIRINCDQYPYCASSTSLKVLIPMEYTDGGSEKILQHLRAPDEKLLKSVTNNAWNRGNGHGVLVTYAQDHPEYAGKYLDEIAEMLHLELQDAVIKVLLDGKLNVSAIFFTMNEDDLHTFMKQKTICVGSDSTAHGFNTGRMYHPRTFGTFPRYFETVRNNGLLPLEDAVRKCTGLPAEIFGLPERGLLKAGYYADIAVFDEEKIASTADYMTPDIKPDGIQYVIVNGKFAVAEKKAVNLHAGHALIHPAKA